MKKISAFIKKRCESKLWPTGAGREVQGDACAAPWDFDI
jgi:hypothetical protein